MAAAEHALAMDANLAEAHAALGYARFFSWDWPGTEASFKRALELNPNLAVALDGYNWGYLTQIRGQYDSALTGEQRAAEIDPLNSAVVGDVGFILYHAGRQEAAIDTGRNHVEALRLYHWLGFREIARYCDALENCRTVSFSRKLGSSSSARAQTELANHIRKNNQSPSCPGVIPVSLSLVL